MTTANVADAPPVLGKDYEQLVEYLHDSDTPRPRALAETFRG